MTQEEVGRIAREQSALELGCEAEDFLRREGLVVLSQKREGVRRYLELPDGYLYLAPIVNWGRYREENGRLLMPVSVRLNHAIADGFLVANVFRLLQREMDAFVQRQGSERP